MRTQKIWWVLLLVSVFMSGPLFAQVRPPTPSISQAPQAQPTGAPVTFAGETLFFLYDRIGPFTAEDRARAITERLTHVLKDPFARLYTVTAVDQENTSQVVYGDIVVMTVTDLDARQSGKSRFETAQAYAYMVQAALVKSREQMTVRTVLIDIGWALLDTLILVGLLLLLQKTFPKIYAKITSWRGTIIRPIRIQRVELLSAAQITATLVSLAKFVRIGLVLILLYVYFTSVLGIFPWTRGIATILIDAVLSTLRVIGEAFATYMPNVVSIAVIIAVTRYILKAISLVFVGIGRGAIRFAGFHQEWAEPTYRIVRFLVIVFAAIAIFPYIPGSQSEGFRGISVFLGLLISLGSAAAIGNVVSGVVLTYMRPFRVGDRVKIADTFGDITEKTLLVTRVRTIKNVDITIPNALVLSSHIVNFSSSPVKPQPLILHTSVTIGYDAPWRKVHELLIAAARSTSAVLESPEPFVLQTSLNDFYVTYEINAYTNQPNRMALTYAELHQQIQDKFNEAGVEIMSSHYMQLRDGNKTTMPDEYLPKDYQAPGLRVMPLGKWTSPPSDDSTAHTEGRS